MGQERTQRWVEADAGPLLVTPASLSDRAADLVSSVSEHGSVQIHRAAGKDILLLADDECFPTTFQSTADGGKLIRWVYAESEVSLLRAASAVGPHVGEPPPLRMWVEETLLLRALAEPSGASITIDLPRGEYEVSSREVRPDDDDDTLAVVVFFSRVTAQKPTEIA
jgi:hypothetical protein